LQGFLAAYTLFIFDYVEDSTAEEDANFVFYQKSYLIEIQGTGEESDFTPGQLI
jgi:ribonuclease PH